VPDTLAEELLLLAYDIRGKCRLAPVELDCGVAGALLSELNLAGRLTVEDGALVVADDTPVGDPILDGVLFDIASSSRRTPREWVSRLGGSGLDERFLTRMAERGQIQVGLHRTLGVFTETRYPVRDIVGLWDAHQRIVAAVTADQTPDRRTLALGALATAAGMARTLFATSGNWRVLRGRMRELTGDDWAAEAVRAALSAERRGAAV
jgi:Golgi phosphoprotein 3 (GPP34)